MSGPCELTAREARRLIGAKRLSPVELLESCIARIEQVNPAVNAVVTDCFARAREEAKRAEQAALAGEALGPLHGIPVAIKDNQDTEGVRTAHGSPHFQNNVPAADCGIVAAIREAGGIVVGKTNIPEFSIGANTVNRLFGATGNPFDPQRTCGGSSGGSAVALSCEMVPLATGSDHGGSLRIPASFCGVVGHRSSAGVVPNEKRAVAQSFYSVQGPMARSVADAALLLSVIARRPTRDPMAFPLDPARFARLDEVDLGRLRVAVSADLGGLLVSRDIRQIFRERVARFGGLFRECAWHDVDLRDAPDVDWKLRSEIFVAQYHKDAEGWDADFNPNIRNNYAAALRMPMRDVAIAHRLQMELCQRFQRIFDEFDLLICPTVSVSPFPWAELYPQSVDGRAIGTYMEWLGLTASLTVVGHPVTALPCGRDAHGMPFGLQIVGPNFADHAVLGAAHALEAAFAADPVLARPSPEFAKLTGAPPLR
jgi:amidase